MHKKIGIKKAAAKPKPKSSEKKAATKSAKPQAAYQSPPRAGGGMY